MYYAWGFLFVWELLVAFFLFCFSTFRGATFCVQLQMHFAATEPLISSNNFFVYPAGLKSTECFLYDHALNLGKIYTVVLLYISMYYVEDMAFLTLLGFGF